ncbi:MAG: hypothetical protein R8L07_03090 [Alphaproteobacteria bacterium]|nr:hypothetical protein [Alphaproteobacteria bacterium]
MLTMLRAEGREPRLSPRVSPTVQTACFSVTADADPGMLSRVLGPVAKRGLVVDRVNALREEGSDPVLLIDMQVSGLDDQGRDIVAAVLSQTVGVRSVLVCDKSAGRAA